MELLTMSVTGILGLLAQMCASDKNAEAQGLINKGKETYEKEIKKLEQMQIDAQNDLINLGNKKKSVLDGSINRFLSVYERIKNIELTETEVILGVQKFDIKEQDIIDLHKLEDMIPSVINGGVVGGMAGVALSLATSGSLSIVTTGLSVAGQALSIGEVGLAVGLAADAVSIGAIFTPVSVVVGPGLMISGFSAYSKADDNYETAQGLYAELIEKTEKIKISETMCKAVSERSNMLYDLLNKIDDLFAENVEKLDEITGNILDRLGDEEIILSTKFTKRELEHIAVTRALAGAVKSIIDVPIISDRGDISEQSLEIYDSVNDKLPDFEKKTVIAREESKLKICPVCGNKISRRAKECPFCRKQ